MKKPKITLVWRTVVAFFFLDYFHVHRSNVQLKMYTCKICESLHKWMSVIKYDDCNRIPECSSQRIFSAFFPFVFFYHFFSVIHFQCSFKFTLFFVFMHIFIFWLLLVRIHLYSVHLHAFCPTITVNIDFMKMTIMRHGMQEAK